MFPMLTRYTVSFKKKKLVTSSWLHSAEIQATKYLM